MSYDPMSEPAVAACHDLVGRAGATRFEIGYLHDDVPDDEAGWYAIAFYRGTRISVEDQPSSSAAADGLARLLLNGMCRCGRPAVLDAGAAGCLWRRVGKRWEPGCDVAPIVMAAGERGDGAALNRAMRRRLAQGRGA